MALQHSVFVPQGEIPFGEQPLLMNLRVGADRAVVTKTIQFQPA